MKKLSMILTFLVIFGSSAIGHTSDEYVVFEGIFEMSTRRPVAQFEYFQALDGEAIVKVYNEAGGHRAKKGCSATISINGKKVIFSRDFYKKKSFHYSHYGKKKFFHYLHFKQQDDYIEKTVELSEGRNSLEVMVNGRRGGKIKVVIVKPKLLVSDDSDDDSISDDGYDNPCTGGNTALCNDNCPNDFNPDQADSDGDEIGDVCDDSDTYPNIVTATIAVGSGPYGPGIAVSPNGDFVYVSNFGSNSVSVIKTSDNSVIDIPVGNNPMGVSAVVTPNGEYVYVNNFVDGTVSVIDTADNTVIDTDPIPVGNGPFGISVTSGGEYAYVSNYWDGTVSVIDTVGKTVIDTIDVGNNPMGVSVTPNGEYVYVSNYGDYPGTVSVINTVYNSVIDIPVGNYPMGISVTPKGDYVYVSNFGSDSVSVIRTSDNSVTTLTKDDGIGIAPSGVSVTPNGAFAYVNNYGSNTTPYSSNTVSVIRRSDNTVIDTIQVEERNPLFCGIAVSPDGKFVYVRNDGKVSVIGF